MVFKLESRILNPARLSKPSRTVNRVFIHCTATDHDSDNFKGTKLADTIHGWHREKRWAGIGYHYVIDKDGTLVSGRSIERIPSAQGKHNLGTLAICLHGLALEKFTAAQIDTLKRVCKTINILYKGRITFHGHREVSNKTCPVIDYKKILNLDEKGYLGI
jgi:hypothetical protein